MQAVELRHGEVGDSPVIRDREEPLVLFSARRALVCNQQFGGNEALRPSLQAVVDSMPDSFEVRLARATLSGSHEDSYVPHDHQRRYDVEAELHRTLLDEVARELMQRFEGPEDAHVFIDRIFAEWRRHHYTPQAWTLFTQVSRADGAWAVRLAEDLVRTPTSATRYWDALMLDAGPDDQVRLCEAALGSSSTKASVGLVALVRNLRRTDSIEPETSRSLLSRAGQSGAAEVLEAIVGAVSYGFEAAEEDWAMLAELPVSLHHGALVGRIMTGLRHALEAKGASIGEATVAAVLEHLQVLDEVGRRDLQYGLPGIAAKFPVAVFKALWTRYRAAIEQGDGGIGVLLWHDLDLAELDLDHPDVKEARIQLTEKLKSGKRLEHVEEWFLLRLLRPSTDHGAVVTCDLIDRLESPEALETLARGLSEFDSPPVVLAQPQVAAHAIGRAAAFGPESRSVVMSRLSHVGGGRGFIDGSPDEGWSELADRAERLADHHADCADLRELYLTIAAVERGQMERISHAMAGRVDDD